MQFSQVFLFILVANEILSTASGIKWLSIATSSSSSGGVLDLRRTDECDRLDGLTSKQVQLCKRSVDMMRPVREGAIEAITECQFQFKDRRWNCSTTAITSSNNNSNKGMQTPRKPMTRKKDVFGKLGNSGTRESAYVHAITSAGVAYVVTRTCSTGTLDRCGCDGSVGGGGGGGSDGGGGTTSPLPPGPHRSKHRPLLEKPDFEWAGCSDNIAYGTAFSRAFVDARERVSRNNGSNKALMNLHNNEAGRKAIEEKMWMQCKCHGVSGSCELKTCWRSMPKFRSVASILRDRYDGAIEVVEVRSGTRRDLVPRNVQLRSARDTDLVYLEASPDFCEPDSRTASSGTHRRHCSRTSNSTDGCAVMCCGRGFYTRQMTVTQRCHCKFHWCCFVKCQECQVTIVEHICR